MLQLLQAFRFADTDTGHVDRLLHWADLPAGSRLVDLGAGTGFVSKHIAQSRPDISLCLVDNNEAMLGLSAGSFTTHCADLCAVPEADGSFDAAICCYAIGYADTDQVFAEMRRLVRPGGVVFIVDIMPRLSGAGELRLFGYKVRSRAMIEAAAVSQGLRLDFYMEPFDHSNGTVAGIPDLGILFAEVLPVIWRFRT
jgi:ubiquinone/menaquinone biosynthesis C-methylase UbiE